MNICVACGGTGGHIFPGLATAQELRLRGHNVTLWLAGREVEKDSIEGWDGSIISMRAARFPSGLSIKSAVAGLRILGVVAASRKKMRELKPDIVLAMGSYTSVGPVIAAKICHIPVVLHEANAVPGKAISFLSRFATRIAITFPAAAEQLDKNKTSMTGFPLRRTLSKIEKKPSDRFTLLITGGSQGARILNETLPEAIESLYRQGITPDIIHLTGMNDADDVEKRYKAAGIPAEVHAFAKDMLSVYTKADFAITRAGAATCTELAVCGVPALLIPYPTAAGNHQMLNAMAMAKNGGMSMQPQQNLSALWLAGYLKNIIENPDKFNLMRSNLKDTATADGTQKLADLVEQTITNRHNS
jgi:UDP-N-acetylglucosamine--N-acetylmuramyl-(pentapeptide) pyrophosphoryl-undecaprenol N-acetylglucosamine transferase